MSTREHWSSRKAFVLAAIGSAIGLGNIWRFPFKCYESGGGAFLIAYLFAMLSAGIPLMILELSLGHRFKLSAPLSFAQIKKKYEWIGWLAVFVSFTITTYYAVIMAWGLNYSIFSLSQTWGQDTGAFFYNQFLKLTEGPFDLGSIQFPILLALIVSWIVIVAAIWKGAKSVSKVVYFTVFLPWLLLIIFVIRGVTLPGAMEGLSFYLKPHFEKLLDPQIWIAAYGQVFYSLSIGFGIMIAYASFLPKESGIINSALIIALSDGATAFIGGFAVFGALGYYAGYQGVAVETVLKGGPGLAFVSYPAIINMLPLPRLFGILFFLMLLTLAVDSAFSLVESTASSLRDKFRWSYAKSNFIVTGAAFIIGILFTTGAGLYWLDIVDKWLEVFGLSVVVFFECIVLGWFFDLDKLRTYANSYSEVKVGKWWLYLVKYLIPIVVGALVFTEAANLIKNGYGGYPAKALFLGGWLIVVLLLIISLLISLLRDKRETSQDRTIIPQNEFIGKLGYARLHRYFAFLLGFGVFMLIAVLLNSHFKIFSDLITPLIAIFVFLSLIGGAMYFAIIAIREDKHRLQWSQKIFKDEPDYPNE